MSEGLTERERERVKEGVRGNKECETRESSGQGCPLNPTPFTIFIAKMKEERGKE